MTKTAPEAKALTKSAVLDLFLALKEAASPADFLGSADSILANSANLLPLPVSPGMPEPLEVVGNRAVDIDNAPRVHDHLGEMDRANACDARLWTYLAFGTYRNYMEKRWPLEHDSSGSDKWKNRARDRWLLHVDSVTRGKLVRHGIARLWWVAHLTFEPGGKTGPAADDAYAYTKEVFKSEDRINAIFDREVGAFPSIRKKVLEHAAALGSSATDKHVQRVMQYLTLVNGYRDIGVLEVSDLNDLIDHAKAHA